MKEYPATNLQMIRRTRKTLTPGDIFVMQLPDSTYLFGRVMDADIQDPHRTPWRGTNLLYIYDYRSATKEPDLSQLTPDRLLIPPQFCNKLGWSRGYFETVAHEPLMPSDWLEQVSYWDTFREKFIGQNSEILPGKVEPCGIWAMGNYRHIDDRVSDALGIPRVPVEDE